ncbi:50S ribosomal protein L6 [Candidatus Parcubacteria bacterium]|nr:50S ribosomal protein L6 [Candidatus Parcubacteria bacterium]
MSRVGKKPIVIPAGVDVTMDGSLVRVSGPKGELSETLHPTVRASVVEEDGARVVQVTVTDPSVSTQAAQWGTARALLQNMVTGVTAGFSRQLEVNGVGFRVNMKGKDLVLNLGFSHDVPFGIPEGIQAAVEGNVITISGSSRQRVGEIAAQIRRLRKPEPYKGKGIKYVGEVIRRKAGKAQKAGE